MPWNAKTILEARENLCARTRCQGKHPLTLRHFGISPNTGYNIESLRAMGEAGLRDDHGARGAVQ